MRRDVYDRRATTPVVHDGSPTYAMQRSIVSQDFDVADTTANADGLIVHRGRAGVADGAQIWAELEDRHQRLLQPGYENELVAHLAALLG